jgi:hypothetical protein
MSFVARGATVLGSTRAPTTAVARRPASFVFEPRGGSSALLAVSVVWVVVVVVVNCVCFARTACGSGGSGIAE